MVENIIPFIGGEEEKSEQEPLRVLGRVENGQIVKADSPKITCQCVRVPVDVYKRQPLYQPICPKYCMFYELPHIAFSGRIYLKRLPVLGQLI